LSNREHDYLCYLYMNGVLFGIYSLLAGYQLILPVTGKYWWGKAWWEKEKRVFSDDNLGELTSCGNVSVTYSTVEHVTTAPLILTLSNHFSSFYLHYTTMYYLSSLDVFPHPFFLFFLKKKKVCTSLQQCLFDLEIAMAAATASIR
jgi:hypothetical protein